MDSSSIVCMADTRHRPRRRRMPSPRHHLLVRRLLRPPRTRLNELHWITKVEEKRGRTGFHINSVRCKSQRRGRLTKTVRCPSLTAIALRATPISRHSRLRTFQAVCSAHGVTGISRHALRNRGRRGHGRRRANTNARTPKSPGESTIRYPRSSTESLGCEDEKTPAPVALGSRWGIHLRSCRRAEESHPFPGSIRASSAGIAPLFAVIHSG